MQAGARACKAKHVHPPHIQMCSCIYVCMTTFTGPHAHIDCFFFKIDFSRIVVVILVWMCFSTELQFFGQKVTDGAVGWQPAEYCSTGDSMVDVRGGNLVCVVFVRSKKSQLWGLFFNRLCSFWKQLHMGTWLRKYTIDLYVGVCF